MYNILLVEDDKNIREMLVEYFAKRDKEKFNITLAENGLKGLDKAYENSYDLLLLDVMLPEMDGFTLSGMAQVMVFDAFPSAVLPE